MLRRNESKAFGDHDCKTDSNAQDEDAGHSVTNRSPDLDDTK